MRIFVFKEKYFAFIAAVCGGVLVIIAIIVLISILGNDQEFDKSTQVDNSHVSSDTQSDQGPSTFDSQEDQEPPKVTPTYLIAHASKGSFSCGS
jgi:cytoskeletal protein RodZ